MWLLAVQQLNCDVCNLLLLLLNNGGGGGFILLGNLCRFWWHLVVACGWWWYLFNLRSRTLNQEISLVVRIEILSSALAPFNRQLGGWLTVVVAVA